MKTEIKFVHAVQNKSIENQVIEKLEGLERKYDWITRGTVSFKEEKHPNEENYVCEIMINVPGTQLFASSNEINFNKSINSSVQQLSNQLEKMKTKMLKH